MIDLSPLKKWILKLDDRHTSSITREYLLRGFDTVIDNQIDTFCNCEKTLKDGTRCIQTNDNRYALEISTTIWLIDSVIPEEERDKYYLRLLERHNKNLEFEAVNGFSYDPKIKKKSTTKKSSTRKFKTDVEDKPKEHKETAAERKLKAHALKLSALSFKPKAV